jgi:protein JSN1
MQMRTLDYLGLADTPQPPRAQLANPFLANIADIAKQANRFRSYSVNAKEKYAEDEEEEYGSGNLTPYETQQAQLHMQLAATNAAIQQHNLAVQAFANQASSSRPRARTAGVLESPTSEITILQPPVSTIASMRQIWECQSPENMTIFQQQLQPCLWGDQTAEMTAI